MHKKEKQAEEGLGDLINYIYSCSAATVELIKPCLPCLPVCLLICLPICHLSARLPVC